jgi:hypothetical protein
MGRQNVKIWLKNIKIIYTTAVLVDWRPQSRLPATLQFQVTTNIPKDNQVLYGVPNNTLKEAISSSTQVLIHAQLQYFSRIRHRCTMNSVDKRSKHYQYNLNFTHNIAHERIRSETKHCVIVTPILRHILRGSLFSGALQLCCVHRMRHKIPHASTHSHWNTIVISSIVYWCLVTWERKMRMM